MKSLDERFFEKVEFSKNGCWEWVGAKNDKGYGQIWGKNQKVIYAHRVSYEATFGDIPQGLQIDHLCRNRACVNPFHMEVVTNRINILRGNTSQVTKERLASITQCPQGHPYSETNTIIKYRSGYPCRTCKICDREHTRKWRKKNHEKALLYSTLSY